LLATPLQGQAYLTGAPVAPTLTLRRKFSVLRSRIPRVGAGFGCCGLVWVWLRAELDVEQRERFGLDVVGVGEAGEGVGAVADA
jgi:hypothetical protein